MSPMLAKLTLLAQDGGGAAPQGDGGLFGGFGGMLFPLVLIFIVFYFLMIRPQRQEQARRQAMLEAVKKNDRVVTIGGIYGVVTNVQRDSDEITIKVDESNNTKLRMTFSSIARVLGDDSSAEGSDKS
jgi:preprotein translocase subunit YajC